MICPEFTDSILSSPLYCWTYPGRFSLLQLLHCFLLSVSTVSFKRILNCSSKHFYDGCFKILIKDVSGPKNEEVSWMELLVLVGTPWILPPCCSLSLVGEGSREEKHFPWLLIISRTPDRSSQPLPASGVGDGTSVQSRGEISLPELC